jgi:regulator of sigma E protease
MTGTDSARSFVNAKKWKQTAVLLSGISFNVIFAWLLISISFMFGSLVPVGEQSAQYSKYIIDQRVIVTQIMPESPAALAGLVTGDGIIKITADNISFDQPSVQKIQEVITGAHGSIVLNYKRSGVEKSEVIIPKEIDGKKVIGIYMENVGLVRLNPFLALWEGGKLTAVTFKQVIVGLVTFLGQAVRGQGDFTQVSGPVGMVNMVGDAAAFGPAYFLGFVAFISLNLAVINLMPFPALDGGRVLFVLIEAIIRRPIKPKIANTVNAVGFFILISLMIIITYRDIMKFF